MDQRRGPGSRHLPKPAHNCDDHDHDHDHGEGHAHDHAPAAAKTSAAHGHGHHHHHHHHHGASGRIGTAFFLNLGFAIIEMVGGIYTNSMAVTSDALHDFGDAMALGMAWYLERKSRQSSDHRYTYGYRRLSVASALVTGCILVIGCLLIIGRSIPRVLHPEPVHVPGMLLLALMGIVVNGAAFWRLSHGDSLNEKMLRWHFVEDITGWILVLIGGGVMLVADVPWLDPLMAVMLSCWVLWNVAKNIRYSLDVFLQVSPQHLQQGEAEVWMRGLVQVSDVHHAHIWSLDGEAHIMTVHVAVAQDLNLQQLRTLKVEIKKGLKEKFGILEATIEFESAGEPCVDPEHQDGDSGGGGHHHH